MVKFIIRATLLLIITFHCVAKESEGVLSLKNYSSPFQSVAFMDAEVSMNFDLQISWRTWTLLGEPVIDSKAKWLFNSITLRKDHVETVFNNCPDKQGYNCLPESVIKNISLINLELLARAGNYAEIRYGILLNPGAFNAPSINNIKSAKPSFNTPSSPDWQQTLVDHYGHHTHHIDLEKDEYVPEYLPAKYAKRVFSNKMELRHLMMTKFSAGYSALFDYLREKEQQKQQQELDKDLDSAIQKSVKKTRQTNQDDILGDFEQGYIEEIAVNEKKLLNQNISDNFGQQQRDIKRLSQQEDRLLKRQLAKVNSHVSNTSGKAGGLIL